MLRKMKQVSSSFSLFQSSFIFLLFVCSCPARERRRESLNQTFVGPFHLLVSVFLSFILFFIMSQLLVIESLAHTDKTMHCATSFFVYRPFPLFSLPPLLLSSFLSFPFPVPFPFPFFSFLFFSFLFFSFLFCSPS